MFIHCMQEEKYVTKFMSTFGKVGKISSHKTRRTTAEGSMELCYPQPGSLHNKTKHWVDDHNQRRHSPIDIAESWKTQRQPHCQIAFFLAILETNTANSRGQARGEVAEPQLKIQKALAMLMLENTLDDNGKIVRNVEQCLRTWDSCG